MKKNKYSFIIPVYNSEKDIERCIDSICTDVIYSKIKDCVEIILVENGTTDNSLAIIKKCQKKYKNINIILTNSEKGVSFARNKGIEISSGEYLIFVDSDDIWIENSLCKINENTSKNNMDLFVYSFFKGSENLTLDKSDKIIHDESLVNVFDLENKISWFLNKPTYRMQVWSKVFKSDIIKSNNIYFDTDLKFSEDSEFLIRYLLSCKDIFISKVAIYKYVLSNNSAMRTFNKERLNMYLNSLEKSSVVIKNQSEIIKKAFSKYVLSHLNIILVHDIFEFKNKLFKNRLFLQKYKLMKKLFEKNIFRNNLDNIKIYECFEKTLLPQFFYKIHFSFLTAVLCYLKSFINYKNEKKV